MIDDEPTRLTLAKMIEFETGLNVDLSYTHEAIFRLSPKHRFVQVPGMQGECFELIEEMKNTNPSAHYMIYTVLTTSMGFRSDLERSGHVYFRRGAENLKLCDYISQYLVDHPEKQPAKL